MIKDIYELAFNQSMYENGFVILRVPGGWIYYLVKEFGDNESETVKRIRGLIKKSINEMGLTLRSYNCLKANDIKTVADLVSKKDYELLRFKNFGLKSLYEIKGKLGFLAVSI